MNDKELIESLYEEFGKRKTRLRDEKGRFIGNVRSLAEVYIYTLEPDKEKLPNYKVFLSQDLGKYGKKVARAVIDEIVPKVKKISEYKSYLQRLLKEIEKRKKAVENAEKRLQRLDSDIVHKLNLPLGGFLENARKRKYESIIKGYTDFGLEYKSKLQERIKELENYLSDYQEVLSEAGIERGYDFKLKERIGKLKGLKKYLSKAKGIRDFGSRLKKYLGKIGKFRKKGEAAAPSAPTPSKTLPDGGRRARLGEIIKDRIFASLYSSILGLESQHLYRGWQTLRLIEDELRQEFPEIRLRPGFWELRDLRNLNSVGALDWYLERYAGRRGIEGYREILGSVYNFMITPATSPRETGRETTQTTQRPIERRPFSERHPTLYRWLVYNPNHPWA